MGDLDYFPQIMKEIGYGTFREMKEMVYDRDCGGCEKEMGDLEDLRFFKD